MRTTLTLDDDVLAAVKGLANQQRKSAGAVVSLLVREALRSNAPNRKKRRNGVPLLPVSAHAMPVTLELVNQLRDEWPS